VILIIAGGAALATSAVFGILSASEDASLDDGCGTRCAEDDVASLRTYTTVADVALVVGLAAGITGTILLLTAGGGDDDERTADAARGIVARF
jgi:hypothetical protein